MMMPQMQNIFAQRMMPMPGQMQQNGPVGGPAPVALPFRGTAMPSPVSGVHVGGMMPVGGPMPYRGMPGIQTGMPGMPQSGVRPSLVGM